MSKLHIVHIAGPSNTVTLDNDVTVYRDEHSVCDEANSTLFVGTYTQCLIFVGALSMRHSRTTAMNFARGIYR